MPQPCTPLTNEACGQIADESRATRSRAFRRMPAAKISPLRRAFFGITQTE